MSSADLRAETAQAILRQDPTRLQDAVGWLDAAVAELDAALRRGLHDPMVLSRRAQLLERRAALAEESQRTASLGRALAAYRDAAEIDPYGVQSHLALADALWRAGRKDEARGVYRRALELDDLAYLDPLVRLPDADVQLIRERIAGAGTRP